MTTKSLPIELRGKLAKLFPLLGSDQPGEVSATVAAINTQLKAHACDWHDVTAAIILFSLPGLPAGVTTPDPFDTTPTPNMTPSSEVLADINLIFTSGIRITKSGVGFLHDMRVRATKYKAVRFTERQREWFDSMKNEALSSGRAA